MAVANAAQGCVRPATAADAEAVARVHVRSWQHAYRGLLPDAYLDGLSVDERRTKWAASIAQGRPALLVADVAGQVGGFVSVGQSRDTDAQPGDHEIWAIYVAPDLWARGVGRLLWSAARDFAREHGAARLSLWVFANNPRARAFYEAVGMRAEPGSAKSFVLGGVKLDEIRYALALA